MTAIQTTTRTTGSKPLRQTQQDRENEGKGHMQDKSGAGRGTASGSPIELPEGMWKRIATKAYELWEQRGCRVVMTWKTGATQKPACWERSTKPASERVSFLLKSAFDALGVVGS